MTDLRAGRVAFACLFALSLVILFSPTSGPSGITVSDKLVHLVLFAALAVTGRLAGVPTVQLAIGLAGYAGVSEVLQAALPIGRDGDVRDAFADVLGVATGLILFSVARRRRA